MNVTIRQIQGEEMLETMYSLNSYSLHASPPYQDREDWMETVRGRPGIICQAVYEDEQPVSVAVSTPMTQNMRGRLFPVSGVKTYVFVPPLVALVVSLDVDIQIPRAHLHQRSRDVVDCDVQPLLVGLHFADDAFELIRDLVEGKHEIRCFIVRGGLREAIGEIARRQSLKSFNQFVRQHSSAPCLCCVGINGSEPSDVLCAPPAFQPGDARLDILNQRDRNPQRAEAQSQASNDAGDGIVHHHRNSKEELGDDVLGVDPA